ncbi:hypothetical protein ISN44_As11g032030 [Arabidopsis suecica]|uniref:Uncharacterized protein n=1 Tax=Arabidopsis suecica TaxID=45249 RepID=A0A8T1ZET4_ARASU|nr:hypothetical protein ISN44_As11g032030 [Arabidopsis suecica]
MALKPEGAAEKQPENTIDWIEFRDTLLASQTAMQNSITALTQALLQNRLNPNPPPVAAINNQQENTIILWLSKINTNKSSLSTTLTIHNNTDIVTSTLDGSFRGSRSVDVYAKDFYLLLRRTDIHDTQVQLVSRFIGGMRPQLQSSLSQFDPTTISEAHCRAATFEHQLRPSSWNTPSSRPRSFEFAMSPAPTGSQDTTTIDDDAENLTYGDHGIFLVSRRSCIEPPSQTDNWLRYNIFKSTCTIHGRICTFIIDSGSSRNVISENTVRKLELPVEAHPCPYSLTWLHDGVDLGVTHRTLVLFSIGLFYKDCFYFDISPMDVAHLVLGRPWEYDRKIIHDGAKTTYKFTWETHHIVLLPSPDLTCNPAPKKEEPPPKLHLLYSYAAFTEEFRLEGVAFALLTIPSPPFRRTYQPIVIKVVRAAEVDQTVVHIIRVAESRSKCCEIQTVAECAKRFVKIKELRNAVQDSVRIEAAEGASNLIFFLFGKLGVLDRPLQLEGGE